MTKDTHASMDSRVMTWAGFVLAAFIAGSFASLASPPAARPPSAAVVQHQTSTG
jgi:hypothetical protein